MIELTEEQARAVATAETTPPRVVNPQTQETFVLLSLSEYERLARPDDYDDSPWTKEERDQLREEGWKMLDSFGKDA
jgi:hypothetical protein